MLCRTSPFSGWMLIRKRLGKSFSSFHLFQHNGDVRCLERERAKAEKVRNGMQCSHFFISFLFLNRTNLILLCYVNTECRLQQTYQHHHHHPSSECVHSVCMYKTRSMDLYERYNQILSSPFDQILCR